MRPFLWLLAVDSRRSLPVMAATIVIVAACSLLGEAAFPSMAIVALIGGSLACRLVFLDADGCGWNTFVVSAGVSRNTLAYAMFASQVLIPAVLTAMVSAVCLSAIGADHPAMCGATAGAVYGMAAACNVYYSFSSTAYRQPNLGTHIISRKDYATSLLLTVLALFMAFATCSGAWRSGDVDGLAWTTAIFLALDMCLMALCLALSCRLMARRDL